GSPQSQLLTQARRFMPKQCWAENVHAERWGRTSYRGKFGPGCSCTSCGAPASRYRPGTYRLAVISIACGGTNSPTGFSVRSAVSRCERSGDDGLRRWSTWLATEVSATFAWGLRRVGGDMRIAGVLLAAFCVLRGMSAPAEAQQTCPPDALGVARVVEID